MADNLRDGLGRQVSALNQSVEELTNALRQSLKEHNVGEPHPFAKEDNKALETLVATIEKLFDVTKDMQEENKKYAHDFEESVQQINGPQKPGAPIGVKGKATVADAAKGTANIVTKDSVDNANQFEQCMRSILKSNTELVKASAFGGISIALAGIIRQFEIFHQVFSLEDVIKDEYTYVANMRAIAFETQGITGLTRGLQDRWQETGKVVAETGYNLTTFQKNYTKNLRGGIRSQKEMLTVTKAGLNTAYMIGSNAETTNELFAKWHMHMGLTVDEASQLGRDMQTVARNTGVTGDKLLNVMQQSEGIIKNMRNAGTLTTNSIRNITEVMAEAQKVGVEDKMQELLKAMSSTDEYFFNTDQSTRSLLNAMAGQVGKVDDLQLGMMTDSRENMALMGQGLHLLLKQIGVKKELKDMSARELQQLNISLHGYKLQGQQAKLLEEVLEKRAMSLADKMAAITKEEQNQNLTAQERLNLEERRSKLTEDSGMNFLTTMAKATADGTDLATAFAKMAPDVKHDLKDMNIATTDALQAAKEVALRMAKRIQDRGGANLTADVKNASGAADVRTVTAKLTEELNKVNVKEKKAASGPMEQMSQSLNEINESLRTFARPGIMALAGIGVKMLLLAGTLASIFSTIKSIEHSINAIRGKSGAKGEGASLPEEINTLSAKIKAKREAAGKAVTPIIQETKEAAAVVAHRAGKAWENMSTKAGAAWEKMSTKAGAAWEKMSTKAGAAWEKMATKTERYWKPVTDKWAVASKFTKDKWKTAAEFTKDKWKTAAEFTKDKWAVASKFASDKWTKAADFTSKHWKPVAGFVSGKWEKVTEVVGKHWGKVTEVVGKHWGKVTEVVGKHWGKVTEVVGKHWGAVKGLAGGAMSTIGDVLSPLMVPLTSAFGMVKNVVMEMAGPLLASMGGFFDAIGLTSEALMDATIIIPIVIGAIGALMGGFYAFNNAAEIFGKTQEKLTFAEKASAASAGALTGILNFLTFGIFNKWLGSSGAVTKALAHLISYFEFLFIPIAALLGILVGLWRFVKNTFIGLWEGLQAIFEPFVEMFNEIKKAISPIFELFGGSGFNTSGAAFNLFADGLGALGKALGTVLKWTGKLIGFLLGFFVPPLKLVINVIAWVVKWIAKLVEGIISPFKWLYDVLIGHSIIPDLVFGIIKFFAMLPLKILAALAGLVMKIPGLIWEGIKSLGGLALKIPGLIWEGIKGIGGLALKIPGMVWTGMKGIAKLALKIPGLIWDGIKGIGGLIWKAIVGGLGYLGKFITAPFKAVAKVAGWVAEKAGGAWNTAKGVAGKAAGWVGEKAGGAWNTAKGVAGKAAGWVGEKAGGAWNTAKGVAGKAAGWVGEKAGGAWNTAKGVAGKAAGLAGKATGFVGNVFSKGKGLIGGLFGKGAISKVASFVGSTFSKGTGIVGSLFGKVIGSKAGSGMLMKTIGGSLLRKLPGVGAIVGVGLGLAALMKGDIGGAIKNVASGLLSTIPVVGTALSFAVDFFGDKMIDGAKWVGGKIADFAGGIWNGAKWVGSKIADFAGGIWSGVKNVGGAIADFAGGIWSGVKNVGGSLWEGAKTIGKGIGWVGDKLFDGVKTIGSSLWKGAKTVAEVAGKVITAPHRLAAKAIGWVWDKGKGLLGSIFGRTGVGKAARFLGGVFSKGTGFVSGLFGKIYGNKAANAMADGISKFANGDLIGAAKSVASGLWSGVTHIGSTLWTGATAIGKGIGWVGDKLWDGAKLIGEKAVEGAKWIGNKLSQGAKWIAEWMKDKTDKTVKAISEAANGAVQDVKDVGTGIAMGVGLIQQPTREEQAKTTVVENKAFMATHTDMIAGLRKAQGYDEKTGTLPKGFHEEQGFGVPDGMILDQDAMSKMSNEEARKVGPKYLPDPTKTTLPANTIGNSIPKVTSPANTVGNTIPNLEAKSAAAANNVGNNGMMNIPIARPAVQSQPLTDTYERMNQRKTGDETSTTTIKSDELVSIDKATNEQTQHLIDICDALEDIKRLLTPNANGMAGRSPSPLGTNTESVTTSFGDRDYAQWQFGMIGSEAASQVLNDGTV